MQTIRELLQGRLLPWMLLTVLVISSSFVLLPYASLGVNAAQVWGEDRVTLTVMQEAKKASESPATTLDIPELASLGPTEFDLLVRDSQLRQPIALSARMSSETRARDEERHAQLWSARDSVNDPRLLTRSANNDQEAIDEAVSSENDPAVLPPGGVAAGATQVSPAESQSPTLGSVAAEQRETQENARAGRETRLVEPVLKLALELTTMMVYLLVGICLMGVVTCMLIGLIRHTRNHKAAGDELEYRCPARGYVQVSFLMLIVVTLSLLVALGLLEQESFDKLLNVFEKSWEKISGVLDFGAR